jgi:hypothetical protein
VEFIRMIARNIAIGSMIGSLWYFYKGDILSVRNCLIYLLFSLIAWGVTKIPDIWEWWNWETHYMGPVHPVRNQRRNKEVPPARKQIQTMVVAGIVFYTALTVWGNPTPTNQVLALIVGLAVIVWGIGTMPASWRRRKERNQKKEDGER